MKQCTPGVCTLTLSNDIALVRLAEAVDLSVFTPVCLPDTNQTFTGQNATVVGWGGKVGVSWDTSNILQELGGLEVLGQQECRDILGWLSFILTYDMLCVEREKGKTPCYGDSGGPFMVEEEDKTFTQVGVNIWSLCRFPKEPGTSGSAEVSSEWKYLVK